MVTKINTKINKDKDKDKETDKGKKNGFKPAATPYDVVVPEGFTFADHKPLKKKNFASEELYFLHRAAELEFKAGLWRKKAEDAKAAGTPKERAAKRRLEKMQSKIDELKDELTKQGVDVAKLMQVITASKQ